MGKKEKRNVAGIELCRRRGKEENGKRWGEEGRSRKEGKGKRGGEEG